MKIHTLFLCLVLLGCNHDEPKPPIYDMTYTQVLSHMHGTHNFSMYQEDSWHYVVELPDGSRARIQESTRVDLCNVFRPKFCI
jgi:hypothetical protein